MAWRDKQVMHEYLKEEYLKNSNLERKESGTVTSEANEIGVELLTKISWKAVLQKFFDEQSVLLICDGVLSQPLGEYEATLETKAREKQFELMGSLRVLIARDNSAIAWAKRKHALCFVKFVVDRIATQVLEECVKTIKQLSIKREEVLLRALLELNQDMLLQIPMEEPNDMDSY